jgi:hypothetical protein
MTYGFIITRHVNSEETNKYWNQCVKLIRTHYPFKKIVIIDDNSNQDFVNADFDYKNIEIIQSEYPKRGELLPYIYYIKNKWFDNAVIIHDSVFIHKRINFSAIKTSVLPLWHHVYDKENLNNLMRISSYLNNSSLIKQKLKGETQLSVLGMKNESLDLCFGVQAYINHNFLLHIQKKYNITNLVNAVHCRSDRCALERIMGMIFCIENRSLLKSGSLFGDIVTTPKAFQYKYKDYIYDFRKNTIPSIFVKVWTGR